MSRNRQATVPLVHEHGHGRSAAAAAGQARDRRAADAGRGAARSRAMVESDRVHHRLHRLRSRPVHSQSNCSNWPPLNYCCLPSPSPVSSLTPFDSGNFWRFPFYCYKFGGGAFLVPYTLVLLIIGIPLFMLELYVGQKHQVAATHAWPAIHPAFGGLGIAGTLATFFVALYYNVIVAWGALARDSHSRHTPHHRRSLLAARPCVQLCGSSSTRSHRLSHGRTART